MGRIPDEIVQQIRDHTDVVQLIGRSVSLKRAGRNYKGLCPFHDEKTPSFNVNPDRGSFYCFGCQEGGDAFSFLMKTENLTFGEAARSLAREAGLEIPVSAGGESGQSEALYAANQLLAERYRDELGRADGPGVAYLAGRDMARETIESFGIGWAPDRWDFATEVLRRADISAEIGEKAGLISPRKSGGHYDLLRGRVVFPIQDARGRVVAFGGRAVSEGQEPKYLNTPESPIFRKRQSFYGFPHALEPIRRRDRAVVSEGYFDRIALHLAGVEEAVATCGTALTADHARNLRRRTRNVVLLFDGDAAGLRAIWRALEVLLPGGLRARAALLPAGDDPDTFLRREGAEALRALVDAAVPALDLAIDQAVAKGCDTPWAKADAVAEVAPLLALVPSAVERSEHCARLAVAVGTEPRHVEAAVRAAQRGDDVRDAVPAEPRSSGPEERHLAQLTRALVEHPTLASRVDRDELRGFVSAGPMLELATALIDAATDGAPAFEALREQLCDQARIHLDAFTMQEERLDPAIAGRSIDDILRWFRKQQRRARQHALTERLREPGVDPNTVIDEKKRLVSNEPPPPSAGMGTVV